MNRSMNTYDVGANLAASNCVVNDHCEGRVGMAIEVWNSQLR